jgi:glycosyltransferase involved in cell wall biosynthesis
VLKEQLDWEMITALATIHRSWSFVMVGPVRATHDSLPGRLATLQRLPNVHLLGGRSADALPAYVQGLDVALLPYRRNFYTDCINPMKLYESLAAGTPIVASRIRTLEDFASVVSLAGSIDEWTAGITGALTEQSTSDDRRAERQAIARAHDWDAIVAAMAATIAPALGVRAAPA